LLTNYKFSKLFQKLEKKNFVYVYSITFLHKKQNLKNVGPIRHCEPPHAHSPGVASGTVACRLRIDVHDIDNDDDNDNNNA